MVKPLQKKHTNEKWVNWRVATVVLGMLAFAIFLYLSEAGKTPLQISMELAQSGHRRIILTPPETVPTKHQVGMQKFQEDCAQCHGQWAGGTKRGPRLVHTYYKPSLHSDYAFYQAVLSGVRAHHWSFGNMPVLSVVTPEDMDQIIPFVRWWQRENGIE
ncbi:c-type cytochrome [Magnetococcales bacterium HHB-1]